MEILKFGDNPSPNRSNNNQRKPAAMIVAGVLVAMMGMSTTLAGTISIGTNSRVEFGQGVVATAACDSELVVTPTSSYSVANNAFTVSEITISQISNACLGKWFTIRAYSDAAGAWNNTETSTAMALTSSGNGSTAPAYIKIQLPSTDTTTATAYVKATAGSSVPDPTITGTQLFANSSPGQGQFTLGNLSINNSIIRITVESSDS